MLLLLLCLLYASLQLVFKILTHWQALQSKYVVVKAMFMKPENQK